MTDVSFQRIDTPVEKVVVSFEMIEVPFAKVGNFSKTSRFPFKGSMEKTSHAGLCDMAVLAVWQAMWPCDMLRPWPCCAVWHCGRGRVVPCGTPCGRVGRVGPEGLYMHTSHIACRGIHKRK